MEEEVVKKMERTDHSASCCRQHNTCIHIIFFLGYCNCDTMLCFYKTLRKKHYRFIDFTAHGQKEKGSGKKSASGIVHTAHTSQLELLCIVWQSNSTGENEILLQ